MGAAGSFKAVNEQRKLRREMMRLVFSRIAHHEGYENCCLFSVPGASPAILNAPCYANSAVIEFVGTFTEQTLNFLKTHSAADFTECALQLQHELPENSTALLVAANQAETDDLAVALVNAGARVTQMAPLFELSTPNGAQILIETWGAQNHAPFTNFLVVSPLLAAQNNAILERDTSFGVSRRSILFHNRSIELNIE